MEMDRNVSNEIENGDNRVFGRILMYKNRLTAYNIVSGSESSLKRRRNRIRPFASETDLISAENGEYGSFVVNKEYVRL